MKLKKRLHRLLSVLLCCVLLVGMMPAVETKATESISSVSVSTIPILANTKIADLFAATGVTFDEAKMTLYEVSIKHNDTVYSSKLADTFATFKEGETYEIFFVFYEKEGYKFEVMSAAVNDEAALIVQSSPYLSIKISYTVPAAKELINVDVLVTAPKSGEEPDYTAKVVASQNNKVSVDGDVYWGYGQNGSKPVAGNGVTFLVEQEYLARVSLVPAEGYKLSEKTACTINGKPAALDLEYNTISYTFPPLDTYMLEEVSATCKLISGTKLSEYDFGIGDTAGYEVRNVTWYSIEHSYSGDKDVQIGANLWASTEIDATKDYRVDFVLKAKTGYMYTSDTKISISAADNAIVTIGGETLQKERTVSVRFVKAVVGKTNINISPLVIGEKTDTVMVESDNENCVIESVDYYISTGGKAETFEEGVSYLINISIKPTDRYLIWDIYDYSKGWNSYYGDEVGKRITVNNEPIDKEYISYSMVDSSLMYGVIMESHSHEYASEWKKDETRHWHECSCGDKKELAAHTTKTSITPATASSAGKAVTACTVCGKVTATEAIARISSVKLSATNYIYDGKAKTPTVTVKDSKGKVLVKGTDYTVAYASGRTNVGKYKITVKFKGKYSGTKNVYMTIKPKGTSISGIAAVFGGFKVKWNKMATQTTGYQVMYSTSSSFKSPVTATISKNTTLSYTKTGLAKDKKYYVRVRTYKIVGGAKYYSSWSAAKAVTTTSIKNASSYRLSASSYVYDGKVKTPTVVIKNYSGNTLVKGTDYTVAYSSGRKVVGRYAVKISFRGKYSGTKTLYFTINPKANKVKAVSALSAGFKLSWSAVTTQTTGYQIMYSASSNFSGYNTKLISSNKTLSTSVTGLTKGKKYYVKVRTYKTVGTTKYYSAWSPVKYVTTK